MKLPPPRHRPKLAQWRYERNLTLRATADHLARVAGYRICSHETIRVLCLPFGDAERIEPWPELAAAIAVMTEGLVTAPEFEQPKKDAA